MAGLFGTVVKYLTLPVSVFNAAEQMRTSTKEVSAQIKEVREIRRAHVQREREIEAAGDPMGEAEEIANTDAPLRQIRNPAVRFEVAEIRGRWTPSELEEQWVALRLTKMASWITGLIFFAFAWVLLFIMPVKWLLLTAVVAFTLSAFTLRQALRFGLMQSQIERRSFHSLSTYLARPDFLRHVLIG